MKKTPKTKSESKPARAALLREHDAVERQLTLLARAADTSDKRSEAACLAAKSAYDKAEEKADAAYEKAVAAAEAARAKVSLKVTEVHNDERDAIAKKRGPLRRRLEWLKSEIRRDFVVASGTPLTTTRVVEETYVRSRRAVSPRDFQVPTEWTPMSDGKWERRRDGSRIFIRRIEK